MSKYNKTLQKQIRENEIQRISERKAFFEEGLRLDEEAKLRRQKLDEIKRKKLEELKYVHFFFNEFLWFSSKKS